MSRPSGGTLSRRVDVTKELSENGLAKDELKCASWVTAQLLLLIVNVRGNAAVKSSTVEVVTNKKHKVTAATEVLRQGDGHTRLIVIARSNLLSDFERIDLTVDRKKMSLSNSDVSERSVDVRTLLREELAGHDVATRHRVLEKINTIALSEQGPGMLATCKQMRPIRDALRERFPLCIVAEEEPQGLQLESLLGIDDQAFWMKGWIRDADSQIRSLSAISPEGVKTELLEQSFRHRRPDVESFYSGPSADRNRDYGFLTYFQTELPSVLDNGWIAQLSNEIGMCVEAAAPAVVRDPGLIRNAILSDLNRPPAEQTALIESHCYPALSRLQERIIGSAGVQATYQFGEIAQPTTSVIVPLYHRIDFVEHQLTHFALDSDFEDVELIYVLDSPEDHDALIRSATDLFEFYRVPFRVVILDRNVGFSAANNIGVDHSRGRLILLLNSDVIPCKPGWLSAMVDFYDATDDVGAVGAKLLYEDDSLQHAGMYFRKLPACEEWENAHFFKGLHGRLPAANVLRQVPAVTGACMMIDREVYREAGGLRGMYVQGDYEDSDLCLRLIESGRSNWYFSDAALYHLEGQSYPNEIRQVTSRYNRWLHSHLWGETIESLPRTDSF